MYLYIFIFFFLFLIMILIKKKWLKKLNKRRTYFILGSIEFKLLFSTQFVHSKGLYVGIKVHNLCRFVIKLS